jgi:DNA-binding IclR family transcriptional regulator
MWVAARRPGQLSLSKTGLDSSVCSGYMGTLETIRKNYRSYFRQRQDEDLYIKSQIENYSINFDASIGLRLSFRFSAFGKKFLVLLVPKERTGI